MSTTALVFALFTIFCWGIGATFDKLSIASIEPLTATTLRGLMIGLTILIFGTVTGRLGELSHLPLKVYLYVFCAAIPAGLLGQVFYYHALKLDEASRVVPITSTYPLIAVLIAAVVLREPLTTRKVLGLLTVMAGIYLLKESGTTTGGEPRERTGLASRATSPARNLTATPERSVPTSRHYSSKDRRTAASSEAPLPSDPIQK